MRRARALTLLAVAAAIAAWRRGAPFPARVAGASMAPTLRPGDLIAVVPLRRAPRRGEVVLARRADGIEVVKRVTALPGERVDGRQLGPEEYFLAGDDPAASTDSRELGPFPRERIAGRVGVRYWPPSRAGLIGRRAPR